MEQENRTKKELERFANELAKIIVEMMESNYDLSVEALAHTVLKTNGERMGITVRTDNNEVAPTLYVDDAYKLYTEGEKSLESIAMEMAVAFSESWHQTPEKPILTQEEAKEHITLVLVNTEMNQELLSKTPHMKILDGELAAIPRWYISPEASFVVSNELTSKLGLTPDEVLQIGQQRINSQDFVAKPIQEVIADMMGVDPAEAFPPMEGLQIMVLTSESTIQGSNVLLSRTTLDQVHEVLEGDYAILPSSIHEVIAMPIREDMKPEEFRSMVHSVNNGTVSPDERLSNNIFMYDGHKLILVGDSFKMDEPKLDTLKIKTDNLRMHM